MPKRRKASSRVLHLPRPKYAELANLRTAAEVPESRETKLDNAKLLTSDYSNRGRIFGIKSGAQGRVAALSQTDFRERLSIICSVNG